MNFSFRKTVLYVEESITDLFLISRATRPCSSPVDFVLIATTVSSWLTTTRGVSTSSLRKGGKHGRSLVDIICWVMVRGKKKKISGLVGDEWLIC